MALVPFKPTRDLFRLQDEINRMFESFLPRFREAGGAEAAIMSPVADITETENEIIVEAELPGMQKEDIQISLQDNVLSLKGERKKDVSRKDAGYRTEERYFGRFQRSFTLPNYVDEKNVKASFKDGVLKIQLPKKEEAKAKQIDISVN